MGTPATVCFSGVRENCVVFDATGRCCCGGCVRWASSQIAIRAEASAEMMKRRIRKTKPAKRRSGERRNVFCMCFQFMLFVYYTIFLCFLLVFFRMNFSW